MKPDEYIEAVARVNEAEREYSRFDKNYAPSPAQDLAYAAFKLARLDLDKLFQDATPEERIAVSTILAQSVNDADTAGTPSGR